MLWTSDRGMVVGKFDSYRNNEDYNNILLYDTFPSSESTLAKNLKENPKLLVSETAASPSLITVIIANGCLFSADKILLENGQFVENADPFYCGTTNNYMSDLFTSVGLNIYLALMAFRFFSSSNLVEKIQDQIHVKKTHYDSLYWVNIKNKKQPVTFEGFEAEQINQYTSQIAPYFMKEACKITELESELHHDISVLRRKEIQKNLGDWHLKVARMETCRCSTYLYFLKKSREYYFKSDSEKMIVVDNIIANYDSMFSQNFCSDMIGSLDFSYNHIDSPYESSQEENKPSLPGNSTWSYFKTYFGCIFEYSSSRVKTENENDSKKKL